MPFHPPLPFIPVALLMLLAVGCGSKDRQDILIGKWGTTDTAALAMTMKVKQEGGKTPPGGYKGVQAAMAVAAEFVKDGTYTLVWQGIIYSGTWTLDKASGEVELKIASAKSMFPGDEGKEKPNFVGVVYTAVFDEDNDRLNFFPVDPKTVKSLKGMGGKGMSNGIPLEKK
jgi:hypothetical protein